jgi:hypothetical protein
MAKQTIEQLYQRWKRPASDPDAVVTLDYAWAEDNYSFKEWALIHHFTENEIADFEAQLKASKDQP